MVTDARHNGSIDFLQFLRATTTIPLKSGLIVTTKFYVSPRHHPCPGGPSFWNLKYIFDSRLQRHLAGGARHGGSRPCDGGCQLLSMEISSPEQAMPSKDEYLEDMVRIWKRKQAQSESAFLQQRDATAGRHPPVVQGTPACRPTGGAPTSASSLLPAKQRKWHDYIVVVKPRVHCELRTCVPADRAGDAIRNYLGDRTTTLFQVWPIWEQNILVCSTTMLPMAQKLLGDFQLQVGGHELPVRGHAKPSRDTCRGVITINPAETLEKIKSELYWPRGTILAVRKLGECAAAVVTFEDPKLPRFHFYHCVATYIRPYKKTVPACTRCGTIGHRPPECPHPTPTQCAMCGIPTPKASLTTIATPIASSATAPTRLGKSGCAAKYWKPKPPSTFRGPTSSSSQPNEGTRMHRTGPSQPANTQAFPLLVAPAAALQLSSWAWVAASQPLSPPAVDAPPPRACDPSPASGYAGFPKPSARATCTPINPPAPVADEPTPAAPAVSGAPQAPLPTNPTQPSEDRVPRIGERLTRVEASINHLNTNFSVQRIVVERANSGTLTSSHLTPEIDPHLLHLWDARRVLIKRWKRTRGTPEAAVLSPLLFNLAMKNLPCLLREVEGIRHALYADDITFWTNTGSPAQIEERLQKAALLMDTYAASCGLECSPAK
ncbi:hypothetical protein HPB52_001850 [Rhipicephalus sanguineus]|uniref:CCHC-type domain-containing protein n=1 Tax=Rhipicephalus sanguineus TaxID=34632 RepID=A0A9D4SRS4_RHISA|nr:hypothetical protein HPB52_001850 [Rhipicephalus sanguineus]